VGGTRGIAPARGNPGGGGITGVPSGIRVTGFERASGYGGETPGCGGGAGPSMVGPRRGSFCIFCWGSGGFLPGGAPLPTTMSATEAELGPAWAAGPDFVPEPLGAPRPEEVLVPMPPGPVLEFPVRADATEAELSAMIYAKRGPLIMLGMGCTAR
jgi:hypothetical protein